MLNEKPVSIKHSTFDIPLNIEHSSLNIVSEGHQQASRKSRGIDRRGF